jgi:hypothetical protein
VKKEKKVNDAMFSRSVVVATMGAWTMFGDGRGTGERAGEGCVGRRGR